jgi:hypothetical protein
MIGWWISLPSFFNLLYLVQVRWEGEDKLWWAPSKRGLLDVRASPARMAILATHYTPFFILATSFSLHTPVDHLF